MIKPKGNLTIDVEDRIYPPQEFIEPPDDPDEYIMQRSSSEK